MGFGDLIGLVAKGAFGIFDEQAFDHLFGLNSALQKQIIDLQKLNDPKKDSVSYLMDTLQDLLILIRSFRDKGTIGISLLLKKDNQRKFAQEYLKPLLTHSLLANFHSFKEFQSPQFNTLNMMVTDFISNVLDFSVIKIDQIKNYERLFSFKEWQYIVSLDFSKKHSLDHRNYIIKQRLLKIEVEKFQSNARQFFDEEKIPTILSVKESDLHSLSGILKTLLVSIIPKEEKNKKLFLEICVFFKTFVEVFFPTDPKKPSDFQGCIKESVSEDLIPHFEKLKSKNVYRMKEIVNKTIDPSGLIAEKGSLFESDGKQTAVFSQMDVVFNKHCDKMTASSATGFVIDYLVFKEDRFHFLKEFTWAMIVSFDTVYGDKLKKLSKTQQNSFQQALYEYIDAYLDVQYNRTTYKGLISEKTLSQLTFSGKKSLENAIAQLIIKEENEDGLSIYEQERTKLIHQALYQSKYNFFKKEASVCLQLKEDDFIEEEDFFKGILNNLFLETSRLTQNIEPVQALKNSIETQQKTVQNLMALAANVSKEKIEKMAYFKALLTFDYKRDVSVDHDLSDLINLYFKLPIVAQDFFLTHFSENLTLDFVDLDDKEERPEEPKADPPYPKERYYSLPDKRMAEIASVKTSFLVNKDRPKKDRGDDGMATSILINPLSQDSNVLMLVLQYVSENFFEEIVKQNNIGQTSLDEIKTKTMVLMKEICAAHRGIFSLNDFNRVTKEFSLKLNDICQEEYYSIQNDFEKLYDEMIVLKRKIQREQQEETKKIKLEEKNRLAAEKKLTIERELEEECLKRQLLEKQDQLKQTQQEQCEKKDKISLNLWKNKLPLYSAVMNYLKVSWLHRVWRKIKIFFTGGQNIDVIGSMIVSQIDTGGMVQRSALEEEGTIIFASAFVTNFNHLKHQSAHLTKDLQTAVNEFSQNYPTQLIS